MNRAGHLSISGATGTGKSALARHLLFERGCRRRLILDPLDEYESSAVIRCRTREDVKTALTLVKPEDEFSLRFVPEDCSEPEAAGYLAQWAMHLGDCVLMVDEAHEAAKRNDVSPHLVRAVKRGRHRGVWVWIISQRPADVDPTLRAELMAQEAWYLCLAEHRDLEILSARRGPLFAKRVSTLPELHALRLLPREQDADEYKIIFKKNRSVPLLVNLSKQRRGHEKQRQARRDGVREVVNDDDEF